MIPLTWFYFSIVGAFAFGYVVGLVKGVARGQVQGINFATRNNQNSQMMDTIKKIIGGKDE